MRFAVRVKPGARREVVGGTWEPTGALIVSVTAAAQEGKANDAVRRALAAAFDVPVRAVHLVHGDRGRDKLVEIDGPVVAERLRELLKRG